MTNCVLFFRLWLGLSLLALLWGQESDSAPPPINENVAPVSVSEPSKEISKKIPSLLEEWKDWARWTESKAPNYYNDEKKRLNVWASELELITTEKGGEFKLPVTTFDRAWVRLPGDREAWPLAVKLNGTAAPVMEREGAPCILVEEGEWVISGKFRWDEMPQTLLLPREVGVLKLTRAGQVIQNPSWEGNGKLWLKRTTKEAADKNYLEVQVYRNLADGSPMWLHTDIELTVTGKSREEELGAILPVGWRIAVLESQIPCAVDDKGLVKTQVRAGKWVISLRAFRTTPAEIVEYAPDVTPIVTEELISLQNKPDFRLIEFAEIVAVDAAQTTFPDKWKQYPLHLWNNKQGFKINEKMRGMGQKKPPGVSITRSFWLDDDGLQLTYRDMINGKSLQTWRLDAAEGQELGAAKIGQDSQLITKNPANGATGVEVRVRNLNLQSVGRMDNAAQVSATGWRMDAESLSGELFLPPGWRAFAIFGADSSHGDWLTNWSLLDVFLLLIFTVAITRLWGWRLGIVALLAFTLSYHESGVPKLVWALLVACTVLANAIPKGRAKTVAKIAAYVSVAVLLLQLVPFATKQIQQALYPQLESHSVVGTRSWEIRRNCELITVSEPQVEDVGCMDSFSSDPFASEPVRPSSRQSKSKMKYSKKNLMYDSKAKIQTGPAVPEWSWRSVSFSWSGPVAASEKLSFVLIPRWLQRIITVSRVALLFILLYGLLRQLRGGGDLSSKLELPKSRGVSAVTLMIMMGVLAMPTAQAEIPNQKLLDTLKQRLNEDPTGLSQYAQIPQVDLSLDGRELKMQVEVHAVKSTAVPIPGRLAAWSPVSVKYADGSPATVARQAGFLWVVVEPGTHRLMVEGIVPSGDWEWSFHLKPQYVNIEAPSWTITGVEENGIPENQVFFVEQNRSQDAEAAYDRKDFNPIFKVDRRVELGLVWESTTTVRRLSPLGKAVSISLPLLPGERILTPGLNAENGRLEIRLGAQQQDISWQSQINQEPEITLLAEQTELWVEEWQVVSSSIWNLAIEGLAPIYERHASEVVPIWKPWPGENTTLRIARPEAIAGETLTIRQAIHEMRLGSRQRTSDLKLSMQNSLGMDFILTLAPEAQVSSLRLNNIETPVRKEGDKVIVPLRPGEQSLELTWKMPTAISYVSLGDEVKLPVNCANTSTIMRISPDKRWVIWTDGPLRGPAVRMWALLIAVAFFGLLLGRISYSPLKSYEWVLLFLGLTQIPLTAGFVVVAWLFWVGFKSHSSLSKFPRVGYNLYQLLLVAGVVPVVGILIFALHTGLLGSPEMRVVGESSSAGYLKWFEARGSDNMLPVPSVLSISIWFYRGLMLLWAVWLAFALIRWARWSWQQLSFGGFWKLKPKKEPKASPSPKT